MERSGWATEATAKGTAPGILDLVGGTPLLRLGRFSPENGATLYAKLEFLNPGGSIKDRTALGMIEAAEAAGRLRPGDTIIEATGGNTGIGLALIGVSRGYRVILVVPEKFVGPKTVLMGVLGAEVILTPTEKGIAEAMDRAKALAETIPGAFVPQQFENPANPDVHQRTTAAEIHEQLGRLPDAVVLAAGTGGTFTGVARYFKERAAEIHAVLVEPQGSIWGGGPEGPHKVEGIGSSFWPGALDRSLIDEIVTVDDDSSFATVKELARCEGVLVGGSAGTAAHAAREVARRMEPGSVVVTVFPDGFERYLGRGVFESL